MLAEVESRPELRRLLASLAVRDEGKRAALDQLLRDQLHPALMQFLLLLAGGEDWGGIRSALQAFLAEVAARREQTAGEIVSARPLKAATVATAEASPYPQARAAPPAGGPGDAWRRRRARRRRRSCSILRTSRYAVPAQFRAGQRNDWLPSLSVIAGSSWISRTHGLAAGRGCCATY